MGRAPACSDRRLAYRYKCYTTFLELSAVWPRNKHFLLKVLPSWCSHDVHCWQLAISRSEGVRLMSKLCLPCVWSACQWQVTA